MNAGHEDDGRAGASSTPGLIRQRPTRPTPGPVRSAAAIVVLAVVVGATGCGSQALPPLGPGSTLAHTLVDPDGDGVLSEGPGEPAVARTDLAPSGRPVRTLLTVAQLTDLHVMDEESPLRVEAIDREGGAVQSAFRPQETLTTQVVEAAVRSVNGLHPDAVLVTGDLVDNSQANEMAWFLRLMAGGAVTPDSGLPGYQGVQADNGSDPYYYRPDIDAPRYPGLLADAQRTFRATGLTAPWYPALSNHDVLIQGVVPVDPVLARVALGRRKLDRISSAAARLARRGARSPELFERLLAGGRLGTFSDVSPDARRKPLPAATVVRAVARAAGVGFRRDALVYDAPIARGIRVLVLDTANRRGGADGLLPAWQVQWLRARLTVHRADRFLVVSPTPLERTPGGRKALAALDRASGVVAVLSGDTHRNLITPRRTSSGGYWLVRTSSLIDFPQQARALRLVALADGRVALETWMVDQAGAPGAAGVLGLAGISRELAFLDVQGGRPGGWRGGAADRNAMLFLP